MPYTPKINIANQRFFYYPLLGEHKDHTVVSFVSEGDPSVQIVKCLECGLELDIPEEKLNA